MTPFAVGFSWFAGHAGVLFWACGFLPPAAPGGLLWLLRILGILSASMAMLILSAEVERRKAAQRRPELCEPIPSRIRVDLFDEPAASTPTPIPHGQASGRSAVQALLDGETSPN